MNEVLCLTCRHVEVCKYQKKYLKKIKKEFPAITPCYFYDVDEPTKIGFVSEENK